MRPLESRSPSAAAPAVGAERATSPGGPAAGVPRRTWLNLVPVVAALLALTVLVAAPWIVSRRLEAVRRELVDTTARARRLVHDVETALLLEVAARGEPALARLHDAAAANERTREEALAALAPRLDGDVAVDIARLRALTAQWRAARAGADSVLGAAELLAAAERLDTALAAREVRQRARVQSLESWDVRLPAVLVPILVVTVIAVYWTGRRMAALAEEAERNRSALARASEQKVALLRGLTHDLKNTLWAATGFAALLRDEIVGPLSPTQRDHVTRIGRLIDQAVTAVGDSLEIARADAGALPMSRRRVDVHALLSECAADYGAAAGGRALALGVDFAEELPALETDPSLVAKIVGNLLSNAIKYTPAGGRVWLRASTRAAPAVLTPGAWVAVEVSDTGPGVPPAFRQQIFDEFFRTPTARASAPGAGVGLAMSRRVARALGGEITVDGEDGHGATFTLWLPAPPSGETATAVASPLLERVRQAEPTGVRLA